MKKVWRKPQLSTRPVGMEVTMYLPAEA